MSGARRRILLVSRGLDRIGTGRQVDLAARGLAAHGWDVHVAIVSHDGCLANILRTAGLPVHEISRRPSGHGRGLDVGTAVGLGSLVRRLGGPVVEAWGWTAAKAAASATLLSRPLGLVLRAATPPGCSGRTAWPLRQADLVLADSEGVAAACRTVLRHHDTVRILRPGIPTEAPPPVDRGDVARRHGLDPDRPWTLCVAPLEAPSRLERLVWAMDQIDVVHKRIEHVLVGAGSQGSRLARRCRVQWVDERLHGFASMEDILDLVPHAAVVWQSGEVALGGAILDAMAAGRPTVAVESVTARALIEEGITGKIVPADPVSEFPRHALRAIEDGPLAERHGEAARRLTAERFPLDAFHAAHSSALETFTFPRDRRR